MPLTNTFVQILAFYCLLFENGGQFRMINGKSKLNHHLQMV